jgi:hypothetical protein
MNIDLNNEFSKSTSKENPVISVNDFFDSTNKKSIDLKLRISDDVKIKDIIIYKNNKKIDYRYLNEEKQFDVISKLDLEAGNNKIDIVARDDENLRDIKTLFIRKK